MRSARVEEGEYYKDMSSMSPKFLDYLTAVIVTEKNEIGVQ